MERAASSRMTAVVGPPRGTLMMGTYLQWWRGTAEGGEEVAPSGTERQRRAAPACERGRAEREKRLWGGGKGPLS